MLARIIPAIWTLALALAVSACGDDACRELAEAVCRCETSELAQQQCLADVDSRSGSVTPTAAEERKCEADLATCRCSSNSGKPNLADGDLWACGLANSPEG